MDFFDHQDVARRQTGRLVVLFILAVVGIIAALYIIFSGFMVFGQGKEGAAPEPVIYFRPGLLIAVTFITMLVVGLGSLWKTLALRAGGRTVAESLDGQLLNPGSGDIAERRLLNVVEEMAIASGTPVPPVYVMQEEMGINAFAAGYGPDDAVIGVTRGCMEKLTRDQLQGVIAHEFSHILNGDMRLNIRLMGILHGILVIGLIGGVLLRVGSYSSMSRRRSKSDGGAKIALVGLAIFIIGYMGFFFGKLIKAAVSRQREYLADAAAVQFTRNPDGIAGALKAIGGYAGQGTLQSSQAESCSHMFFSRGKKKSFIEFNSLATHPPLHDRIQRIDPSFDGGFPEIDEDHSGVSASESSVGFAGSNKRSRSVSPPQPKPAAVTPEQLTASVGTIDPSRLSYARELVADLPEALRDAAREPYSARALVYALLLDADHGVRSKQLDHLAVSAEEGMHAATQELQQVLSQVGRSARLPLADLAMPALRQLASAQYECFRVNVCALVHADERIDLFEYALEHMLVRHLDREFRDLPRAPTRYKSLRPFSREVGVILSALARAGSDDEAEASRAFLAGVFHLGKAVDHRVGSLRSADSATLADVDQILPHLDQLRPKQKRQLIGAATVCIAVDGVIAIEEAELLRAISDSLSCPVPPLLSAT